MYVSPSCRLFLALGSSLCVLYAIAIARPSFVDMRPDVRERLIRSLSSWHFEPHKLPEEEVIACSYILFEALYRIENMFEVVGVPLGKLYVAFIQARELQYSAFQTGGMFCDSGVVIFEICNLLVDSAWSCFRFSPLSLSSACLGTVLLVHPYSRVHVDGSKLTGLLQLD